jgi:hypothetical protein
MVIKLTLSMIKEIISSPAFGYETIHSHVYREKVYEWCKILLPMKI